MTQSFLRLNDNVLRSPDSFVVSLTIDTAEKWLRVATPATYKVVLPRGGGFELRTRCVGIDAGNRRREIGAERRSHGLQNTLVNVQPQGPSGILQCPSVSELSFVSRLTAIKNFPFFFSLTLCSNAFDQKLAVAMLRIAEGLDCCEVATANGDDEHGILAQSSYDLTVNTLMHVDSNLSMSSQIPRVQSVPTMGIL